MACALLLMVLAATMPAAGGWSLDPVWDDGLAEVATYESRRRVYGVDRGFETVIITVKEEMDALTGVKADPPHEGRSLVTVLKSNILASVPAGNYTYHYMTSVFVRRDDPWTLVKLAQSSQEWCGTTYKEIVTWDGPPRLVHHSYFDGEADGQRRLPLARDRVPEEQLLIAARGLRLAPGEEIRLEVYGSLITNAAAAPAASAVRARGGERTRLETPAGGFPARRLDVVGAGPAGPDSVLMTLWIEDAPRAALLSFETADGRMLRLKRIGRRDYWSQ